jgi:RND superfamily putative drug exporter
VDLLTDLAARRPRLIAVCWLVLALAGGWAASGINDALSRSFDAPGREAFQANKDIVAKYGSGGPIAPIVLVATPERGRVTDAETKEELGSAVADVAEAVGANARAVSYASTGNPAFVSRDGRTTYAYIFPPVGRPAPDENPQALAAARRAASQAQVGGRPLQVTGVEALSDDTGGSGGIGLLAETLIGGFGALLVLAWVFGSALALVPLLVAAVSILTTFLALRLLTELTEVSFVVQFLVGLIGLGVAIDYSLLVVVRWREERARKDDNIGAVRTAMRTAGRSVAVSGLTVAIGLLALVVVPVPFIRSIGFGGLLIPIISVAAALTLLPALLTAAGPRIDRRHQPERDRRPGARWTAWARFVVRRRRPAAIAGLAVLAVLALTATALQPGQPSVDALSSGGSAQRALTTLERAGLGAGALTPVELLSDRPLDQGARAELRRLPGVRAVVTPPDGAWSVALLQPDAATAAGRAAVDALRVSDLARAGGPAAQDRDLTDAIYSAFPLMVAVIAVITFLLLAIALRSVLLPVKAIILNVLSVAAAFGVVVLVWQDGHGSELLGGVPATDTITNWVPLAIFAFLYGLSMDYEVFILSRMREEHDRTGSTDEAVVNGLGRTGRLVTSAALILFLAFVALGAAPNTEIRILATGLAAGILLDATVVRALVVPALVTLFGAANWWAPARLRRRDRAPRPRPRRP